MNLLGSTQRHQKEGLEFSIDQYSEIDLFCKDLVLIGLLITGIYPVRRP